MKIDSGTLPGSQGNGIFFQRVNLPSQTLRISLTDTCNFKCSYCFREGEREFAHAQANPDLVIKLMQSAKKFGVTRVKLTGGEPLLYRGLISLLDNLRKVADFIDIGTNGYFLDRYLDAFVTLPIDALTISLDTLDPQIFESMAGVNERMLAKVISNVEKAAGTELPIKINCVLTEINEPGLSDLIKFCGEHNLNLRLIEPNYFSWIRRTYSKEPFARVKQQLLSNAVLIVHSSYLPSTYVQLSTGEEISILNCMCDGAHCDLCGRYMYLRFSIHSRLKPCLFRTDTEVEVASSMQEAQIDSALAQAIAFMGIGPHDRRYDEFLKIYRAKRVENYD